MTPTSHRSGRSGRVRRRRAATAAVVVVVVVVVGGRRGTDTSTSRAPTHPQPTASTGAPQPTTTSTVPVPRPPYPVGTISLTVTDPASGEVPARSFTTDVRYPARSTATAPGASPAPLRGPFPLVVFSGGYAVSPEEYSALLDAWAAAGFVVADPVYPDTTPAPGVTLDEGDIVHHPADLSAVITTLLAADRGGAAAAGSGQGGGGTALRGIIDTGSIAAVGHSDGGDVSLAAVANSCCRDPRLRAAVILSGAEDALFPGTYFPTGSGVPLLVVQGTDDDINPPGCSVQLYDQAPQPWYYLSLTDQTHQSPYLDAGPARDTVQQVVVDFLLGTLGRSNRALAAVVRDGNVPDSSTLTVGGPPAVPPGACPGAPGMPPG